MTGRIVCRGLPGGKLLSFASPKESNQRKGDPGLPPLRGSLDISPTSGAAQLALAGHTKRAPLRSSDSARLNLRLLVKYRGGAQGKEKRRSKSHGGQQVAHHSQNYSTPLHWSPICHYLEITVETWISILISILALSVSGITAWLTLFRRGILLMTQPTIIFFGPDGGFFESTRNKVYLRTLLYSSSRKGQVVESMHVTLERGETKQNFSIWVYGQKSDLVRGSGLFVSHEGVTLNHHFLLPPDGSDFKFITGDYRLKVFDKLVNSSEPILLYAIPLVVTQPQAENLKQNNAGLYFDWGPDQGNYYSHIDIKPEPDFNQFMELVANNKFPPTK